MKKPILFLLSSMAFLLSHNTVAQDTSGSPQSAAISRMPYQITVTPNPSRARLKKLVDEVEDDFIDRFNELNLDDDYDIQCGKVTPTMSHIRTRVCEPNFYIEARAENVSNFLFSEGGTYLLSSSAMEKETHREFEVLQQKVNELTETDRDLREVAYVLAELKRRLKNYGKETPGS